MLVIWEQQFKGLTWEVKHIYLHIFRSNFHLHTVNGIMISAGCMHAGIIEHEFLHAIGIYHTQVNISEERVLLELLWMFKIRRHL